MTEGKLLIIDDNKSVLSAMEILLQFEYTEVETISNPNLITSLPHLSDFDIILLDMNFSAGINTGNEGLFWLREIKKKAPHVSVIMMTAYGSIDLAVEALKNGASDFILKPWNNDKLLATIKSALLLSKSQKEIQQLKRNTSKLKSVINQDLKNDIIGTSKAITSVVHLVNKVAKTAINVLITGENGTGKELFAKELHRLSDRKDEVFISVDMGSISETLFESELFGHVKGAFTDAKEKRIGKMEAAHKGTLFLDEIGNLSLQSQAKLLSALQNRVIYRVGANEPIAIDIRLICATNCNLPQMVADNQFREDLLYRINTIHVEVPPLRERGKDVLVLADYYLKKIVAKYGKTHLSISQSAKNKLLDYHWPGNIRELKHAIERAVILCESEKIMPTDFLLSHPQSNVTPPSSQTLDEMERIMITNALQKNDGNYSATANQLGITRQTLYNKIKKMKNS
ncbi:MAG: sigma-54-dependent transcriptional regulator [Flammeovirgaceae bacterium]